MKVRIVPMSGGEDIIVQSNARGTVRLSPPTFWQRLFGKCWEIELGRNELLVIRTDKAIEPDTGIPIRNPV